VINVKFSLLKIKAKWHAKREEETSPQRIQEGLRVMRWKDFTTTLCCHAVTLHSVLASSSGILFSSEVQ
jgi:hypothetical protein